VRVILLQSVRGLGVAGDVVDVAPGHARNLLFPRNLAQEATPANLARREATLARASQRAAREREHAVLLAERLAGRTVRVEARAGATGRLFGSVTASDIAAAVERQLGVALDRRRIELPEPIKALGTYPLRAELHGDVHAEFAVEVVAG
jgi:large subunit ribosomal protein L9